eukprot:11511503-Ditylum_brightwellii.AAC.1
MAKNKKRINKKKKSSRSLNASTTENDSNINEAQSKPEDASADETLQKPVRSTVLQSLDFDLEEEAPAEDAAAEAEKAAAAAAVDAALRKPVEEAEADETLQKPVRSTVLQSLDFDLEEEAPAEDAAAEAEKAAAAEAEGKPVDDAVLGTLGFESADAETETAVEEEGKPVDDA